MRENSKGTSTEVEVRVKGYEIVGWLEEDNAEDKKRV